MSQTLRNLFFFFRYLRAHKSYTPPENVAEIVDGVRNSLKLKGKHFTPESKFQFLTLCAKEFQVSVPNSQLFEMNTTGKRIHCKSSEKK